MSDSVGAMHRSRLVLLFPAGPLAAALALALASESCSSTVVPAGPQPTPVVYGDAPVPASFQTVTVPSLPASCTGQTFFEASTWLCDTGITYFVCGDGSYSGYSCGEPGTGWTLDTAVDPIASGSNACSTTGTPGAGDAGPLSASGSVYVEANLAAPAENAILQYRYCDGVLVQTVVARVPTGGTGSADLGDNGILDADQQLAVNASHTLLFAVNQGSDSIAVFSIAGDGALLPVVGSPFPSGGPGPTSLGVSGNILVVANKASDGVRDLGSAVANYTTFTIETSGALTPTGTTFPLPPHSSPTQVLVVPHMYGGGLVFTTEETGVLRGLQLSPTGDLTQAPGSPVSLPDSLFAGGTRPVPVWPAGLSVAPGGSVLYTGVPNNGSIAAFSFDTTGELTFVSGELAPQASLPCWSVVSADGRRLYFANAGSDNISVWDTSTDPGEPVFMQAAALAGGGNPWGLRIDPTGNFLFVITPRQIMQIPDNEGQLLHALQIAPDGTLAEVASSPVPIPVPFATNPLGVMAVADR